MDFIAQCRNHILHKAFNLILSHKASIRFCYVKLQPDSVREKYVEDVGVLADVVVHVDVPVPADIIVHAADLLPLVSPAVLAMALQSWTPATRENQREVQFLSSLYFPFWGMAFSCI
jgi:hypothetical protein